MSHTHTHTHTDTHMHRGMYMQTRNACALFCINLLGSQDCKCSCVLFLLLTCSWLVALTPGQTVWQTSTMVLIQVCVCVCVCLCVCAWVHALTVHASYTSAACAFTACVRTYVRVCASVCAHMQGSLKQSTQEDMIKQKLGIASTSMPLGHQSTPIPAYGPNTNSNGPQALTTYPPSGDAPAGVAGASAAAGAAAALTSMSRLSLVPEEACRIASIVDTITKQQQQGQPQPQSQPPHTVGSSPQLELAKRSNGVLENGVGVGGGVGNGTPGAGAQHGINRRSVDLARRSSPRSGELARRSVELARRSSPALEAAAGAGGLGRPAAHFIATPNDDHVAPSVMVWTADYFDVEVGETHMGTHEHTQTHVEAHMHTRTSVMVWTADYFDVGVNGIHTRTHIATHPHPHMGRQNASYAPVIICICRLVGGLLGVYVCVVCVCHRCPTRTPYRSPRVPRARLSSCGVWTSTHCLAETLSELTHTYTQKPCQADLSACLLHVLRIKKPQCWAHSVPCAAY